MKHLLLFILTALALAAKAQTHHTDPVWCDVVRQVLADQGVPATVVSDIQNGRRTLHVTSGGRTRHYTLPDASQLTDYSTPISIVMERPDFRYAMRSDRRQGGPRSPQRSGTEAWQGPRSASYLPDEVFTAATDMPLLETALRNTLVATPRIQLLDTLAAATPQPDDAPLYLLRTTVMALQRGESFVRPKASKDTDADEPAPVGTQRSSRQLDRRFAYAHLHCEILDRTTGHVLWTRDFADDDNTTLPTANPMQSVVDRLCRQLRQHFEHLYPTQAPRPAVSGRVLEAAEEDRNRTYTLYINLGTDQQLRRGDVLTVSVVNNVAGHIGREQVGQLSVIDVQGPELALCKVTKGDRHIYDAIHSRTVLIVESQLD